MTYLRSVGAGFAVLVAIALVGLVLWSLPIPAPQAFPESGADISAPGSSPTLGLGAEWTYVDRKEAPEADRATLFPGLSWNQTLKAKRIGGDLILDRHEADLKDRAVLEGFLSASGTVAMFGQNKGHWIAHPRLGTGVLFLGIREAAFLVSPSLSPEAKLPAELGSYAATISVP